MYCQEAMQADVVRVRATDSVLSAAALMRDENIGFLPVVDGDGRAVGTITDRDIAVRLASYDVMPSEVRVGEIMTAWVIGCRADDELRVAETLMKRELVSRVLVLDEERRVLGVISLTDVAKLDSQRHAARTLRRIAERDFRY